MELNIWNDAELGKVMGGTNKANSVYAKQAIVFANMNPATLGHVRTYFNEHAMKERGTAIVATNNTADDGTAPIITKSNISIKARIATLVVNDGPKELLEQIFQGGISRQDLDNKELRPSAIWERLAKDYVNNPDWEPEVYKVNDARLDALNINPLLVPSEPMTGEELRTMYSNMRTQYTKIYMNYKQSGKIEETVDGEAGRTYECV